MANGERQESHEYRQLVERMPVISYRDSVDPESSALYISPQVGPILGYAPDEWLQEPELWVRLLHPDDRDRVLSAHLATNRTGEPFEEEYRLIARDGRRVWVSDRAMLVRDEAGRPQYWEGVMVDITDRKLAEERERRRSDYLAALHETALAALRRLDERTMLETIVVDAAEVAGTDHAYAYVRVDEGLDMEVRAGTGVFRDWLGHRMSVGEGLAGRVTETGDPVVIDDYDAWEGRSPSFPGGILHAAIAVPLRSGPEIVGALGLAHLDPARRFSDDDVERLAGFADVASVALENVRLYAALERELTQRRRVEEELAFLAYHDRLTELPNRAMFENVLELALARAERAGLAIAVVYLDLDDFKSVNDRLGHAAGDELLRALASRLRGAVRGTDLIARHGGDEFLVLLADLEVDGAGGPTQARALAEAVARRLHDALTAPFGVAGEQLFVSASIGVSVYPLDSHDAKTLLRNSDAAMYRSKREGSGGTVFAAAPPAAPRPDERQNR
ncbi:MAG TPA: diguanylate cyclase [Actinomycetota bacterium]|nr:diguanylate cyclase [Actinomycetota bacterium]